MSDFIFLGSKINVDEDCSHEIKRCLLLGRKAITNLDSVLKSRDITLLTVVLIVKAMLFLIVMYGCESWTIKKAEHWRVDAFELWCWKRHFRVPWTVSNQTNPKEKEMATHPSILAWKISWNKESGRLQSMGLQRVGHNWATSLSLSGR